MGENWGIAFRWACAAGLLVGMAFATYDLNGTAPGNFNESSPDIGSREDGPSNCN